MSRVMNRAADISRYVHAGRAVVTLKSAKTGNHLTYKVSKSKNNPNSFFVSVKDGYDFVYVGMIFNRENFSITAKSRKPIDTVEAKTFTWFYGNLKNHNIPSLLEVRHEDHCGRCGKTLTDPDSIDRGIGPECIKKMNY